MSRDRVTHSSGVHKLEECNITLTTQKEIRLHIPTRDDPSCLLTLVISEVSLAAHLCHVQNPSVQVHSGPCKVNVYQKLIMDIVPGVSGDAVINLVSSAHIR